MNAYDPAPAMLIIGAVAACVALYLCWRRLAPVGRTRTAVLMLLRAALLGLLLLAVANPALRRESTLTRPPTLIVALDASRSMTNLPPDATSRYARARVALQSGPLAHALHRATAERHLVDDAARPVAALPADPQGTHRTDLRAALSELLRVPRDAEPAACLLLSDGADGAWRPPQAVAASLRGYGVPVFCLGVGSPDPVPDVTVPGLVAPRTVTEGDRFRLRALVRAPGLSDQPVELTVRSADRVVARRTLAAGETERPTAFELTAPAPGDIRYEVHAAPVAGEVTAANNRRSVVVRVEPRRARLLLIEGHPRREYAFLRRLLLRIEDLETTILLRKRQPAEFWLDADEPRRAQGLSAAGELRSYRAVILSNIEADALGADLLARLAASVEEGGALAMLGGGDAFGAGGYAATPLARVLPVRLGEGAMLGDPLGVRLSGDGSLARALRETGVERWERLPLLEGMNAVAGARAGAEVALEAVTGDATLGPALCAGRHGAGRSLALTVADTWRWRQSPGADEHSRAAWEALWATLVGWLTAPRADRRVVLGLGRDSFEQGDVIRADVHVRDEDLRPAPGADVRVTVRGPDGATALPAGPTATPGVYRASMPAPEPGAYEGVASATIAGEEVGRDRRGFEVVPTLGELTHAARPEVLRAIADETGGRYLPIDRSEEMAEILPLEPETVRREVTLRPARSWAFIALVLLVAGADWLLRRRWGVG